MIARNDAELGRYADEPPIYKLDQETVASKLLDGRSSQAQICFEKF
jgi:hypothetical protein